MKLKRLCDMIPLECGNCPYGRLSEPEFCPCFSSVSVAVGVMGDMLLKADQVRMYLRNKELEEKIK